MASLYPYQQRVKALIQSGKSVILQAPTGAGKTRAALAPFIEAFFQFPPERFPKQCIYSVPMRVLATQFEAEYKDMAEKYARIYREAMVVRIQTGERSDDPKLEGNLIFATVDQTLSNFLNIPYALSLRQGNLNAGAILSSYLVFDELHLFDPKTMLPTTLHLLRTLRGITPFMIMTATFSDEMVYSLAKELNATPLVLSLDETAAIPSQHKTRRIHVVESELTAETILEKHRSRSIAICNTVDRAQGLYEALCQQANSEVEVRLLHSRFLRSDRQAHENWLRREFGKDKLAYTVESAILVATQVVEVGLDITSENLHTELAPAASILQRSGRCARYQGEEGDVWVYRLPIEKGRPQYAPYLGEQKVICERTWSALSERSGEAFDFGSELAVVNQAHGETDRMIIEGLRATRFYIADRIAATIEAQERGAARELIRAVDSRTVIVHNDPESIENPWIYEGFGIFRGSLFGAYDKLKILANELGINWVIMTADPLPETESSRERTVWQWRHICSKEDMEGALIVAINPRLATYSPEIGFRLGIRSDGEWISSWRKQERLRREFTPYRRETFQEHVTRMIHVYERTFYDQRAQKERLPLADEIAYVAQQLEKKYNWPLGTLDNLIRWVIALHDLGKLDVRWQKWAHHWQDELSKLRGEDLRIPADYLAAHTDYNEQDEAEKALNLKLGRQRPNHAAESAAAAMEWLSDHIGEQALARAALTAIVRHHSAGASGRHGAFHAHPAAKKNIGEYARGRKRNSVGSA